MMPLLRTGAAGLATLGLLLDEESGDDEERRRRIEARIAEHTAQKEQEEQSHEQTMGGL